MTIHDTTPPASPSRTLRDPALRDPGYGWFDAGLRLVAFAMIAAAGLMQAQAGDADGASEVVQAVPQIAQLGTVLKGLFATLMG